MMVNENDGPDEPPESPVKQNLTSGMVSAVRARQRQEHGAVEIGPVITLSSHNRGEIVIYALGLRCEPDLIITDARKLAASPVWGVRKRVIKISPSKVGARDLWDESEWVLTDCDLAVALRALSRFAGE